MDGLGSMGYAGSRKRRTGPHPSVGFCLAFSPRMGPRGAGVILLLVVISFFSHFPAFLLGGMVLFVLLPMLGSLAEKMPILFERRVSTPPGVSEGRKEKELLRALALYGEITPTRAALETSLSVSEADRMLSELTKKGHLEVRARNGGLVYALWEHDRQRELPS
jgi:hypothetical protein